MGTERAIVGRLQILVLLALLVAPIAAGGASSGLPQSDRPVVPGLADLPDGPLDPGADGTSPAPRSHLPGPTANWTDTDFGDFINGTLTGIDPWTMPGSLVLAPDPNRWWKLASPVLTKVPSSWESNAVYYPDVLLVNGTYLMYYVGFDGVNYAIGTATSTNGINWSRPFSSPVLSASGAGFDQTRVGRPATVREPSGTFRMLYGGFDGANYEIGGATSADGNAWSKNGSFLQPSTGSAFDSLSVHPGSVILENGTFKVWYDGISGSGPAEIGYATSNAWSPGWTRPVNNSVLRPGPAPWESVEVRDAEVIVEPNGTYRMWYVGLGGGVHSIGTATSTTGTNWTKESVTPAITQGSLGSPDGADLTRPSVLRLGNSYRMWYGGHSGSEWSILTATSLFYATGTFVSRVVDSGAAGSFWGHLRVNATTVGAGTLDVAVRTGDTAVPDGTWSGWGSVGAGPVVDLVLPRSRYLQYRADLSTPDGNATPVLRDVAVEYQKNRVDPPVFTAPANATWSTDRNITLSWSYSDPDGDSADGYAFELASDPNFTNITDSVVDPSMAGLERMPPPLSDGIYHARVRMSDRHGVWSPWSEVLEVRIDATPPDNPLLSSPSHGLKIWSNDQFVLLNLTGAFDAMSGVAGYAIAWDTNETTEPGRTVTQLANGSYVPLPVPSGDSTYVHVLTVDAAGNWATSTAHAGPFWIDPDDPENTAPWYISSSHSMGRDSWSNDTTIEMWWYPGYDNLSGIDAYSYLWDQGSDTIPDEFPENGTSGEWIESPPQPEGIDTWFHLRARDAAGNWNGTASHVGPIQIDVTNPKVRDWSIDNGSATTTDPALFIRFDAHDDLSGLDGVYFTVNDTAPSNWKYFTDDGSSYTGEFNLPPVSGTYTIKAVISDAAYNTVDVGSRTIELVVRSGNRPPVWTPIANKTAIGWETLTFDIVATDPDLDNVTYNLIAPPENVVLLNGTGGGAQIKVSAAPEQAGAYDIVVTADDGVSVPVPITFRLTIIAYPEVVISFPKDKSTVSGVVVLKGRVNVFNSTITSASLTINHGDLITIHPGANGFWTYNWDTRLTVDGPADIGLEANATNGLDSSSGIQVTVQNAFITSSYGGIPIIILLALIVTIPMVLVATVIARRRRPSPPAGTGPGASAGGTGPATGGTGLSAGPAASQVRPAGPSDSSEETFGVESVYLVYVDGRLIHHQALVEAGEVTDKEIVAGMLTAIQSFIRESIDKTGAAEIGAIEYGERRIVIERSPHLYLGLVVEGTPPRDVKERMRTTVERIEGMHAGVIEHWSGDADSLPQVKEILAPLITYLGEASRSRQKKAVAVSVKNALEFYQGFVRLKVGIRNEGTTTLNEVAFKLSFDRKSLRLARIEPSYETDGSEVLLGHIEPGQKRSVAFYLDPIICTEAPVDGTLQYKDFQGELHTDRMTRRVVDIVCPIFYTQETVNAAMLKRLVTEMKYSDRRLFRAPERFTAAQVEQIGKSAIQGHAVRFVRRFAGMDEAGTGAQIELWFYGKVQQTGEEMVIKATFRETQRSLEVFVASDNLTTMTGLLAELGHNLSEQVRELDPALELQRATDAEEQAVERTRSLLERAADSELESKDDHQ